MLCAGLSRTLNLQQLDTEKGADQLVLALLPPYRRSRLHHQVCLPLPLHGMDLPAPGSSCSRAAGAATFDRKCKLACRLPLQALEALVEVALPAVVLAMGLFFSGSTLALLFQ
jgi:hypothetical protein